MKPTARSDKDSKIKPHNFCSPTNCLQTRIQAKSIYFFSGIAGSVGKSVIALGLFEFWSVSVVGKYLFTLHQARRDVAQHRGRGGHRWGEADQASISSKRDSLCQSDENDDWSKNIVWWFFVRCFTGDWWVGEELEESQRFCLEPALQEKRHCNALVEVG